MDEESIYCRRRTEGGDVVFFNLAQYLVGCEFLVVEYEYGSSGKPLSVHLSPYSLAPTGVGNCKVNAVLTEVVPIYTCGEMAHGIEEIMCHHLGFSACSAGEVHQHCIVVVVLLCRTHEGWCIVPLLVPVVETFCLLGPYADKSLESGTLGFRSFHLLHNIFLTGTDDSLHTGSVVAIYDVVGGEHVGGWYCHCPYLVQGEH